MVNTNRVVAALTGTLLVLVVGCGQDGAHKAAARSAVSSAAEPTSSAVPVESATPTPASTPTPTPPPAATAAPVAPARTLRPPAPAPAQAAGGQVAWGLWEPNWQGHGDSVDFGQYTRMDAELGHRAGLVHWFASWDEGWDYDGPLLQQVIRANRTPMITWEAYNRPLKAIAGGQYDGYIDSWARGMAASGSPLVYLRIFHEFNDALEPSSGSGYSWGIGGGTQNQPADLVAAWRHIHDRFAAAGASNVRFIWCPDGVNLDLGRLRAAYPGDSYVDFAGWDAYDYGTAEDYTTLAQVSQRPFILPEVGSHDPAWVQDLSSKLRSGGYGRIRAVVWFDESEWRLDGLPAVRSSVKGMVASFG
jgi:Glycosyl hydrolase family 26